MREIREIAKGKLIYLINREQAFKIRQLHIKENGLKIFLPHGSTFQLIESSMFTIFH